MMRKFGITTLMLLVLTASPAAAISPADLAKQLPRIWCGAFTWHAGDTPQYYRVVLKRVSVGAGGTVSAYGIAENHSGSGITKVKFRMTIVAATLMVTMHESEPNPPTETYDTDGRYSGKLLSHLDRIDARWIGKKRPSPEARIMLLGGKRAGTFPLCAGRVS